MKEPPAGPIPAPYVARTAVEGVDVACQTEEAIPGEGSTWEEMAGALEALRNQDRALVRRREAVFEAFEDWMASHPQPPAAAATWRRLVDAKQEELCHTAAWLAERREARCQRQHEEEARRRQEEEAACARTRAALEEARAQRLAEEQRLRETRDRLEAARAREVDLAEALGDDDGMAGAPPTRRFCPACKRPGPKDASRCPNKANHQRRGAPLAPAVEAGTRQGRRCLVRRKIKCINLTVI